jgi:hypothetical protein
MDREAWVLYDTRTGKRVAISSYLSKDQAQWDLDNIRKRDKQVPVRTHELLPYLEVIALTEETWGSKPGDIIDGRTA